MPGQTMICHHATGSVIDQPTSPGDGWRNVLRVRAVAFIAADLIRDHRRLMARVQPGCLVRYSILRAMKTAGIGRVDEAVARR